MAQIVKAALTYFAVVFTAAFAIGSLRVTVIAPRTGALIAVAMEVPIVLAISWLVAGRVLRLWPLGLQASLSMGLLAFAFLMLAEFALATLMFGQSPSAYLASIATLAGALGLAGQIGFALIPWLRSYASG